jgi:hypothetical protein
LKTEAAIRAHDDAAKDAGLDGGNTHDSRCFDPAHLRQDAHRSQKHREANRARKRCNTVVSVKPIATPMAKSSGRLEKMAPPDWAMIWETICGSHEKFALPTPSKMPATGSTETGSIMHLPIF